MIINWSMLRAKDLFWDLCEVVKVRFMGLPFLNVVGALAVAVAVVEVEVVVVVVVVACASRLRALERKLFMLLWGQLFKSPLGLSATY
jgi:hypothetical protein